MRDSPATADVPERENRGAVVLAGGRSTRFGDADKAVAPLAGVPMIRRVADRLPVEELVVNCRNDQRELIREALDGDVRFAVDPEPDRGPMAGIMTGLRAVDAEYAAVVACDMPFLDPELLAFLFDRASGHEAAIPVHDGWYETTQAVYCTGPMVEACERALARGERKILAPLEDLDWVEITEHEWREHAAPATFENLNTREEFEAAANRLE